MTGRLRSALPTFVSILTTDHPDFTDRKTEKTFASFGVSPVSPQSGKISCAVSGRAVWSARVMGRLAALLILAGVMAACPAQELDIEAAPHFYSTRTPKDRFTKVKALIESGAAELDRSSEHAFLLDFLKLMEVPVSSQMLVFSTTSLQLSLITPSNPRALYFSEDVYVGYIPGGKIEVITLDPELGAIFHIFDIPRGASIRDGVKAERSDRCMNCHSGADSRRVPGLVIKSVVAGPRGGSLDAFRVEDAGHHIPFSERFGGWYVSGLGLWTNHWGNAMGRMAAGKIERVKMDYGERFDVKRYPVETSDLLAHLLHEHQAGFVNRVVEAGYRARAALHKGGGKLAEVDRLILQKMARELSRYILFADEAALPVGGINGEGPFKEAFLSNRITDPAGRSLKDLNLRDRIFQHRCSYMIHTELFAALPQVFKGMVMREIEGALSGRDSAYAYLPPGERSAMREILGATLPTWPSGAVGRAGP